MEFINKTYRYFSALALILFLNSMILPVGLSAASMFCDMEMGADNGGAHTCFGIHSSDQSDDMLSSDNELCKYQQICKEALSIKKNKIEAIPQIAKGFIAVLGFTDISTQLSDYSEVNVFPPESDVANPTPPIFLLNSVFLN